MTALEVTTGNFPGLRNWKADIPGSTVTAYLGRFDNSPTWRYSLWTDDGTENEECIATGELSTYDAEHDLVLEVSAEEVARIAFLLEVEYGS